MSDRHLDGNALGGLFNELFGREMTDQDACCGTCGAIGPLGRALAFLDAPGQVLRCVNCESVLLVAVATPTGVRITVQSLRWVELS